MSIRPGGDIFAKQDAQFNYIDNGLIFYPDSSIGRNTTLSDGQDNFKGVLFGGIDSGNYGLDFTQLALTDADQFPDTLLDTRFVSIDGAIFDC